VDVGSSQNFVYFMGGHLLRAELVSQLGDSFAGVISSMTDYNGYPVTAQQKCLAHLRRHFQKVVKLGHGNDTVLGFRLNR